MECGRAPLQLWGGGVHAGWSAVGRSDLPSRRGARGRSSVCPVPHAAAPARPRPGLQDVLLVPAELSSSLDNLFTSGGGVVLESAGQVTQEVQPVSQTTCVNGANDCNVAPACVCPAAAPDCLRDANPLAPAGHCVVRRCGGGSHRAARHWPADAWLGRGSGRPAVPLCCRGACREDASPSCNHTTPSCT